MGMISAPQVPLFQNPDGQGPGPPQRPHMPGAADDLLLLCSAPTAKTLSARAVCVEPHDGHLIFASSLMVR
jgi:hypothetical protein